MSVLLQALKAILQGGPFQWGRITGAIVRAYDPKGTEHAREMPDEAIEYSSTMAEAIEGEVLATDWDEFVHLPLEGYRAALRNPILVNFRNVFSLDAMAQAGYYYFHSIGRATVEAAPQDAGRADCLKPAQPCPRASRGGPRSR